MLNNSYICALDIGSSKIAGAVASIKGKRITSVSFDFLPSKGIKSGLIIDSIALVDSITKLLKSLKAKSGINIKFVHVNISGQDMVTKHSRAIIPLAERGNKVITASDMQRVGEQARILGSSLEEDIIHALAYSYAIDSNANLMNPLGLYSHRLEVDLYLICGRLSSIQSLSRVVSQSGYEIKNLYFSGLATSCIVSNNELKKGLNLVCDIGSDITEILVFKDGSLKDIGILSTGGGELTTHLSEALKIPFELAEDIKRSHGVIGDSSHIGEEREILVKKSSLYKPIKQKFVSEVITSKAKEICSAIKDAVEKKVSLYEVDNFIVVGRTVLVEGFIETLESTLSIPVKLGRIKNPEVPPSVKEDSALSGQKYLNYLTALGIICKALEDRTSEAGILTLHQPAKNIILKAINKFKEVYQEYF